MIEIFPEIDDDYNNNVLILKGRIWTKEKIISFWNYDFLDINNKNDKNNKNKLTFKETLKLIENEFNDIFDEKFNISFNENWLIDIPFVWINKINNYKTYIYYNTKYVLIPLQDFKKNINLDLKGHKKSKLIHLMTPDEREKYFKNHNKAKEFGSEKQWNKVKNVKSTISNNDMTPAEWKWYHKQENKIYNFKNFEKLY
jgi:hypothetical protein